MKPRRYGHSTHLEALTWAIAQTTGPVLELGAGWYSTPVLAGLHRAGRKVLSVEANDELRAVLGEMYDVPMRPPGKDGIHPGTTAKFDVVLIDHGFPERRAESVAKYGPKARFVVVHDTQPDVADTYPGLAETLANFETVVFDRYEPWTTVVVGEAA